MVCEGHGQVQMVTDGYVWVQMSVLGRGNTKTRQKGPIIGADGQRHTGQAKIAPGTGRRTAGIEANGGE